MLVLVCEIDKNELLNIYKNYISPNEITVLNDASADELQNDILQTYLNDEQADKFEITPYFIEENIRDIEALMQACKSKQYASLPTAFDRFAELIFNIYKQRVIGCKISDIRYVYEVCKDKYAIQLVDSKTLKGWNEGYTVIVGQSHQGNMFLCKDGDFVFSYEYKVMGLFGRMRTKRTHWHPQYFSDAIEALEDYMNGDLDSKEIK